MWVLHAIVLICTGVPKKTYMARSPILKTQAALQLWPGTTSLIQRDCTTFTTSPRPRSRSLTCGWRRDGERRCPASSPPARPDSSRHYASGEKNRVCVYAASESCGQRNPHPPTPTPTGGRWMMINITLEMNCKAWLLFHDTPMMTLKKILKNKKSQIKAVGLQDSQLPGVTDVPRDVKFNSP